MLSPKSYLPTYAASYPTTQLVLTTAQKHSSHTPNPHSHPSIHPYSHPYPHPIKAGR
ncbi:hypothetical protein BO70DRAFT_364038 [Aspergillus heteromorphus CBS 117.55]|uniref:Uncharacterized protein n=1 Tax=Aspergillus heteromorphus CBS 117.55 TaxID=1448321 RepID=A0A317VRG5_9EURO|nr:uncharacterized protein BO70DRAFT_364038 [Aspergillus heteromorphus CBS 117.55]PWY75488.1 hypothetical protein BO70DRAFT_364038 [Aspergillus heteromorphus CBS 117.55]